MLDEGIDCCLDLLHEQAAVNVLLLSPYCYYGAMNRPQHLMGDHGVPLRDNARRKLPMVWGRHHDACFQDTKLRHAQPATDTEYAGREVFAELLPPLRRRGMKLHARIYEPGAAAAKHIANLDQVLTTTIENKPSEKPYWNNPDYRAWVVGTMRDLFQSYELDGVQYGADVSARSRSYCTAASCRTVSARTAGLAAARKASTPSRPVVVSRNCTNSCKVNSAASRVRPTASSPRSSALF